MSDRFELLSQQVTAARRSMADAEAENYFSSIKSDSSTTEAETPAESMDLVASLGIATAPSTSPSLPSSSSREEEERALADLRRQASLMTSFAVEELATPRFTDPVRAAAATRLIEECQRDPKTGRFILGVEVRRQELARLHKAGELPRAAHAARPEAGRLEHFYQKLLAGRHIASGRLKDEEFALYEMAASWMQGILPNAPDPRQMQARRHEKGFLKELRPLLADGFYGRRDEVRQLQSFYSVNKPAGDLAVITGLGGSGKSTLIAHFLQNLRKQERPPLIAWLDFDRASLNPAAPHLLSFEVSRQIGLQSSAVAGALRQRREQIRREETPSDSFRQERAESVSESRDKGSYEMNFEIAKQLALSPQPANALVLVLDTMEEVSRRGELLVDAVLRWASELAEVLKQHHTAFATCVLVAGRLYDAQLHYVMRPRMGFNSPLLVTLPPLEIRAARQLLLKHGVARPMANRILHSGAPRHPLPLLLIAQLEREEPDLNLETIVRDVEALPEAEQAEMFSALVYWRYLARIRDPGVQILAHPGLVLRRVSLEDIRAILIPALKGTADEAGEVVARLQHAIAGAGEEDAPDKRPPREKARGLAALGEAGFDAATGLAAAQRELGRLTQLTGATGIKALQRFLQIDEFAAGLAGLDAPALDEVYARLISYAWLVEARSDGAWHRPDLRRLMIRQMVAQMPAVARAIQGRAADHYASREPAEAMYHRLMLARTAEDCDRLDRDAVRSAVTAIERDAADFYPAARAFFDFVTKGTVEPGAAHLLPLPERTSAFRASGEQLVRLGRFEEAGRIIAARPPAAPYGSWEILTKYALVQWQDLSKMDLSPQAPLSTGVDWRFLHHHRGFAKFLLGDLNGADEDFETVIRTVEYGNVHQAAFLSLRSIIYQLVVFHSRSPTSAVSLDPSSWIAKLTDVLGSSRKGSLEKGLELARTFVLNAGRPSEPSQWQHLLKLHGSLRISIDLLPIDPALLNGLRDDLFVSGTSARGAVAATQHEIARICAEAETVHEVLRQFNALRRRDDLLIGCSIRPDLPASDVQLLLPLLRGPDPEFRDPLRTALARGFATREEAEKLGDILSAALPFRLDSLGPPSFVNKYAADPQGTLLPLVELLDRARVLDKGLSAARTTKPDVPELVLLDDGYRRWLYGFARARAHGTPSASIDM